MPKNKAHKSSKNIFNDLGHSQATRAFIRSELMLHIKDLIIERELTQAQAAELLGLHQGRVSELMNGKLSKFSLEHLIGILNSLDKKVKIVVDDFKRGDDLLEVDVAA